VKRPPESVRWAVIGVGCKVLNNDMVNELMP